MAAEQKCRFVYVLTCEVGTKRTLGFSVKLNPVGIASTQLCSTTLRPRPMPSTSTTRLDGHAAATSTALDPAYLIPGHVSRKSGASAVLSARQPRGGERARSSDRRRKAQFKKLLWFKQPCECTAMKLIELPPN